MIDKSLSAIVAGAGIWGCTVARRLAEAGGKVLVLEKRKAIGGNCRCRTIDGIEVHLYGSHIFHTSNEEVWKFVNRFTAFNDYRHCVLAKTRNAGQGQGSRSTKDGFHLYHLPIGCTLLKEFFGREMKPSELNEADRKALFDAFIRGYTSKQWGVPPEKVDPAIIARLKVRDTYSTDYFDDPYQGIPQEGYNELFRKMLDHPNIKVNTSASLRLGRIGQGQRSRSTKDAAFYIYDEINKTSCPLSNSELQLYYSGPIDELFWYKHGALPWRSLRFETEHIERRDFQGATVVNYTDASVPYTRIHEFRHYHPEVEGQGRRSRSTKDINVLSTTPFYNSPRTIITREYPADWQKGDEPYYPIDTPESRSLLTKYQDEVARLNQQLTASHQQLIVGGRLGGYKYYDMDKSVAAALQVEI